MNQLRYKLMQFLYGRNGIDTLGYATMALYFAVFVVNMFVNTVWLTVFGFLLFVLLLYRFLSRDVARRRRENELFMRFFRGARSSFNKSARRVKDLRTHRYRTCPGCKVTLRLPVKRGKHTVVCPRCKQRVHVRVWF